MELDFECFLFFYSSFLSLITRHQPKDSSCGIELIVYSYNDTNEPSSPIIIALLPWDSVIGLGLISFSTLLAYFSAELAATTSGAEAAIIIVSLLNLVPM